MTKVHYATDGYFSTVDAKTNIKPLIKERFSHNFQKSINGHIHPVAIQFDSSVPIRRIFL